MSKVFNQNVRTNLDKLLYLIYEFCIAQLVMYDVMLAKKYHKNAWYFQDIVLQNTELIHVLLTLSPLSATIVVFN